MTTVYDRQAIIYITLLNEGTSVVRPTLGNRIKDNIFEVLPTENYDPNDEEWEFPPGSLVKCEEEEVASGKRLLIAVEEFKDSM